MQSSLFIHASYHHELPARQERLGMRERFVEYQRDLHRIAGQQLDEATLATGDQYTYVELADALLDTVGPGVLPGLDVLVTSYWTPEFDPEFSAFGPYLHHRWSLTCQSFDVTDQGSTAPVLALQVLGDYLAADEQAASGLLLGVEQSTVPQGFGQHLPAPQRSSAGVVRVSQSPAGASAEICDVSYLNEMQVAAPGFRVQRVITDLCEQFQLAPAQVTLAIRRNTYLYRAFQYWNDIEPAVTCQIQFLPPAHSCMNLFAWLAQLLAERPRPAGHYLFVDEDVESLAAAAVLVRTL